MTARYWCWSAAALVAFIAGGACTSSDEAKNETSRVPPETASYPDTPLGRVAAIVVPNCAGVGCHDAVSKTHGMDLSTPDRIVSAWVNKPGFDHCTGLNTLRVVPGDPAASLVIVKLEGIAVCLQSDRMPLPPRDALTAEQIDVIRAWIAAGAPSDAPPVDSGAEGGGPDAADASEPDGGEADGGLDAGTDPEPEDGGVDAPDASEPDGGEADGGLDAGTDAAPDGGALDSECSAASPCAEGLSCFADACSDVWVCVSHYDEALLHPCEPEMMPYCGCDGVTFEASITCPDRAFSHPGACDDGESCFPGAVRCSDPEPVCPEGQAASVIDDCWGACIPVSSCRCTAHYQCPNLALNTCLEDSRCGPNPRLVDAGTDDAGP